MKQKINDLRLLMQQANIDFYLVFATDEFGCEYTPQYANELLWLTGFTGSFGMALVSANNLYFFTDGRYLLQGVSELPDFEIFDIAKNSPYDIINTKNQQNVAITFKLISALQYQKAKAALASHNIIDINFIGGSLASKGAVKPISQLFIHPLCYGGISYQEKLANFANALPANITYYAITAPDAVCWLLNLRAKDDVAYSPMALVRGVWQVETQQFYLFTDALINDELKNYLRDIAILPLVYFYEFLNNLPQLALDYKSANQAMIKNNTINFTDPIAIAKATKNQTEINNSIIAHKKDAIAFINFLYWLEHSSQEKSEISLEKKLLFYKKQDPDFIYESFASIVGFKEHGAIIHYHASEHSNKKITNEGMLLIDAGSQYLQGTTDITRTIAIGVPSKQQKLHFTLVLKGHIALMLAKFPPTTTGAQLDVLARAHLWQHGLDYAHGTGHGVGSFLNVHEGPCGISKNSHTPLQEGMILSNEPGFYLQNEYGIRIENLMVVVKDGDSLAFKVLSLVPMNYQLIDFSLLNEGEITWLRKYHQEIYDTVGEALEPKVKAWLLNSYLN